MERKLYRSYNNKVIGGVCGGIGEHLGIDPVIIRMLWILITLMGGAGVLMYIAAIWIVPVQPPFGCDAAAAGYPASTKNRGIRTFLVVILALAGILVCIKFLFLGLTFLNVLALPFLS